MRRESLSRTQMPQRFGHVHGEPITGYEDPKGLGEFECENCEYFQPTKLYPLRCVQHTMVEYSKKPRNKDGTVKVHPEGCCEFVERLGRKDKDEEGEE